MEMFALDSSLPVVPVQVWFTCLENRSVAVGVVRNGYPWWLRKLFLYHFHASAGFNALHDCLPDTFAIKLLLGER